MYIRFEDTENNVTFLRINKGYSYSELTDLCNNHYKSNQERSEDEIDQMCIIEWCIRNQLMTLLTDEETNELQKQNTKKVKSEDRRNHGSKQ